MNKPRFYYTDLENYTPEFLIEIILWHKEQLENKDKFIKELKSYIPTGSREDVGCDFNLKKIHIMIEEYIKNEN